MLGSLFIILVNGILPFTTELYVFVAFSTPCSFDVSESNDMFIEFMEY